MPSSTNPMLGKKIRHSGSLTKLGYHEDEKASSRHRALSKSVRKYGYKKTQDKLVALEVLNKNRNPEFSETVRSDMSFLRQRHKTPEPMRR